MSAMDSINQQIAQARAAAGAITTTAPQQSSVPSLPTGGRPVSMREMMAEGVSVKTFLKPDAAGILVGKDTVTTFEEIPVEFRLNEPKPFYGLRYGQTPVVYKKSYDRLVESRSKRPWADVVAEAQRMDSRCTGDYRAVDVPFTVLVDLMPKKGDEPLAKAGDKIGWTSSVTNWAEFEALMRPYFTLIDQGIIDENALIRGKVVHVQKTKTGVKPWGALEFHDFQLVDESEVAAA